VTCQRAHLFHGVRLLAACAVMTGAAADAISGGLTARDVTALFHKSQASERVSLADKDLSNLDLAGLDFKAAILTKANLYGADLTSANLKGANLSGAKLDRAIIMKADFSGANLEGATILAPSVYSNAMIEHGDAPKFNGANLRGARIAARLDGADFSGADLTNARIGPNERSSEAGMAPASKMLSVNFSGATMAGTDIREVDLTFGRFAGTNLAGAKLIHVDLSRADFSGADMTGADLTGSDLEGANLTNVKGFDTVKGLASVVNLQSAQR
jgi:uncharacterized protein YjbI with pentapeptide repeats